MTEPSHSKFSASAASRWLACPGSMVLSVGQADRTSEYAAWGTVAHEIADFALRGLHPHDRQLGSIVDQDGHTIVVDEEMVECVNTYLANVREMTAGAEIVESESRTNYAAWLNVDTDLAWGTADCTALVGAELQVHDLKTGRGVEVDARDNEQMMLYAGGKLLELDAVADIQTIRLVIHQPRLSARPSEWSLTRAELDAWLTGRARSGAASVLLAEQTSRGGDWDETFLRPSPDACRWCKAKATCPALRGEVADTVGMMDDIDADFEALQVDAVDPASRLAACLSKVDLIEEWCKAVRAEVERRLLAGDNVPGYKLVQGKRGNRQWSDATEAEKLLRETFRLPIEKAYNLKLISPTDAEKLAKAGDIGPRQWPKAKTLIVQRDGQPSVAPVSDPRPPITVQPIDDAFETQADAIC